MTLEQARTALEQQGQSHALAFWEHLDAAAREALLAQIAALDFEQLAHMRELLSNPPAAPATCDMAPAPVVAPDGETLAADRQRGIEAIRAGQVGVILVAGGQGSRLGYDGPKGCYPIGPLTDAPLFHFHARKILALERAFQARIPLYVMTSPLNEQPTRDFFGQHARFGLDPDRVRFFSQAMWPALDGEGRIVMDAPGRLFLSPDGHGGMLSALQRSGSLEDMRARNVRTVFYFQVDNPLVDVADPAFIGRHLNADAQFSLKVCTKRDPDEGLGVVVMREGRMGIVEYSELTPAQKNATGPDGRLHYLYGSVAIHGFAVDFLRQVAETGLPLHIAHKKVPMCDAAGRTVTPSAPNAYKFEKFIFDAMAFAERCVAVAFERAEEFSPVKNAEGEDSPATCRRDLTAKWARWLDAAGATVPRDSAGRPLHKIEIDPCYAWDAGSLQSRLAAGSEPPRIDGDVLLRAP